MIDICDIIIEGINFTAFGARLIIKKHGCVGYIYIDNNFLINKRLLFLIIGNKLESYVILNLI